MAGTLSRMKKKYATGGLTGMSGPNKLTTTDEESSGRTYNPLANTSDYYSYGRGPEHKFFEGQIRSPALTRGSTYGIPGGTATKPSGYGGPDVTLDDLSSAGSLLQGVEKGANWLGYDNPYTQAVGKAGDTLSPGKSIWDSWGGGGSGAATAGGAGTLGAVSGSGALGASAPIATDAALSNLSNITAGELFGTSGSAAAGAGAGSLGTTGGTSAITSGAGTSGASGAGSALAGSGLSTALPLAAVAWALSDMINAPKDKASAQQEQWAKNIGAKQVTLGRIPHYILPNGKVVRADEYARTASEAYWNRDQDAYAKALDAMVGHIGDSSKIGGMLGNLNKQIGRSGNYYTMNGKNLVYIDDPNETWDDWLPDYLTQSGFSHGGGTRAPSGEFKSGGTLGQLVNGPGTGRSDEIPARLSAGEYVMDAETVALLGDGSTDAGARKLDQLREKLRAHKGRKLAKGQFSDNAKDPMHYMGAK